MIMRENTTRLTIGVIGLGLMGQAIIHACLRAGHTVRVFDAFPEQIVRLRQHHSAYLDRIHDVVDFVEFADCEIVVEAIAEQLEPKLELLRRLDSAVADVTIASNSSTFMPGELASALGDPSRLLVCHFFNPADTVPLVEIVPGAETGNDRIEQVERFARSIGKTPVLLHREIEGFVANRLQAALLRECYALVQAGVADAETVDTVVRLSLGPRWAANGPIATADLGGLDTFEALTNRLFPLIDNGTVAPQVLRERVARGDLGAKSGRGVYEWSPESVEAATSRLAAHFRLTSGSD